MSELDEAKWEGKSSEEKAFVWFLRALTAAQTVADVNAAAGALLQDLGEEPS